VRDFKATTTASTSAVSGTAGTPMVCSVRMPLRTRLLARSVAPVKSSAMQPSSMAQNLFQKEGIRLGKEGSYPFLSPSCSPISEAISAILK